MAMLLQKSIRHTIKRRIELWDNGEFTTLLAELREADCNMLKQKAKRKDVESSLKTRQRKCMKFVKERERERVQKSKTSSNEHPEMEW